MVQIRILQQKKPSKQNVFNLELKKKQSEKNQKYAK